MYLFSILLSKTSLDKLSELKTNTKYVILWQKEITQYRNENKADRNTVTFTEIDEIAEGGLIFFIKHILKITQWNIRGSFR